MKKLYLIGGAMGVGKTSVCNILKKTLPNSVFLEGDWCWDSHPFQITEETKVMVIDNIRYLLNNFLNCGAYENIIFCWVMHKQHIIDDILSDIDEKRYEIYKISLVCETEVLTKRLLKDISLGIRDDSVINRSLSYLPLYEELDTIKIDNSYLSLIQTAEKIIRKASGVSL